MKRLLLFLLLSAALAAQPLETITIIPWDDWEASALEDLRAYIRIPSINPPADSRPTAAFVRKMLEGIPDVKTYRSAADKEIVVARLKGKSSKGSLMLLHHMDVVPADRSRWPVDPFNADIKDGFLYGRGAVDMKSIGILQMLTFQLLKNTPLEHDLILMATPDEESGGHHGAHYMAEHHWNEIAADYILDEGGFATPDLLGADGKMTFAISVAEKKLLWVKVIATGTAGHGSQPTEDNPNDRLIKVIELMRATGKPSQNPVFQELVKRVGRLKDNKFTRAIQKDTMSLTSLKSGVGDPPQVNVIPSLAEATVDFRLMPDTDSAAFLAALHRCAEQVPGVTVEVTYHMQKSPTSSTASPVFRALEKAVLAHHPGAVVTPYLVPFGTDSNTLRVKGAQCYGFNPLLLNAELVATMHSDAERIPVSALGPALRCYYDAVKGYVCSP